MKKLPIVFSLLFMGAQNAAMASHQDSVVNGLYQGRSRFDIPRQPSGLTYLLRGVPMKSASKNDHVMYGPFQNNSGAALKIMLSHAGNSVNWSEFGAWIGGQKLHTAQGNLHFDVPSGVSYGFSAKDATLITATVGIENYQGSETGLPSAEQFSTPHGDHVRCFQMVRYGEEDYYEFPIFAYLYRTGSMSDGSVRLDEYHGRHAEVTRGNVAPTSGASCLKVDYLDYSFFMRD